MDISFIPCGVAIPLTQAYEEWRKHFNDNGKDVIKNNNAVAQENTVLLARTVAVFTTFISKELNEDYLLKNLPVEKLGFIFRKIMNAITGNIAEDKQQENNITQNITEDKKKETFDGNEQ